MNYLDRIPLVKVAVPLIAGIAVFEYFRPPVIAMVAFAVMTLAFLFYFHAKKHKKISYLLIIILFFLSGMFYSGIRNQPKPGDDVSSFNISRNIMEKTELYGTIISNPEYLESRVVFVLKADRVKSSGEEYKVTGRTRAVVYFSGERVPKVKYGDYVMIYGRLKPPLSPNTPGVFDYAEYLGRQGIYSTVGATYKEENFKILGRGKRLSRGGCNVVFETAYSVKNRLIENAERVFSGEKYFENALPVMEGIIFGEKKELDKDVLADFRNSGTIHILVVSGMNVALIGMFVFSLLCAFGVPRGTGYSVAILFIIFYTILTGNQPPCLRSCIMMTVFYIGKIISRDDATFNSLLFSALLILLYNPQELFDPSFQLSFVTVGSLIVFGEKYSKYMEDVFRNLAERIPKWLFEFLVWISMIFVSTVFAQIGIIPLIAYYFNKLPLISITANLLVVPTASVLLFLGFLFSIASLISVHLSVIFLYPVAILSNFLLTIVGFFGNLPFAYLNIVQPHVVYVAVYYLCIGLAVAGSVFNKSLRRIAVAVVCLFIVFCAVSAITQKKEERNVLKAHFLYVGHGDSAFLQFPHGGNMLIDTGRGGDFDAGEYVVAPFLRNLGVNHIDAILLSHMDADHAGGTEYLIKEFSVGRIICDTWLVCEEDILREDTATEDGTGQREILRGFLNSVKKKKLKTDVVRRGDGISGYKGVDISVLHPPRDLLKRVKDVSNNNSIVVRVAFKDVSVLFTGDLEKEGEFELIESDSAALKSNVIKIGHHGSSSSSGEEFIKAVSPDIAIISAEKYSHFRLPSGGVLKVLSDNKVKTFTTSDSGTIVLETDGKNVSIR